MARILPVSLVLSGLVLAVSAGISAADETPPYKDSVRTELDRAQKKLESETVVWQDHSKWETAWKVPSEHYVVTTTIGRSYAEDLGRVLDQMYGYYSNLLGATPRADEKLSVYVYPTIEEYNQFGNQFGADHSSIYGSFYAKDEPQQSVAVCDAATNVLLARQLATHGCVHQYLARAFPLNPPTWIDEGLACYFEIFHDYKNMSAGFRNLVNQNRFVPLNILLSDSVEKFNEDRFRELAMLFYYLLAVREDTKTTPEKAPFRDYLRKVLNGEDVAADPVHKLVTEQLSELETAFKSATFPD